MGHGAWSEREKERKRDGGQERGGDGVKVKAENICRLADLWT
jgi:hypothetical protein